MNASARISVDPAVMGGKPCLRGSRLTVSTILGMLASGHTRERLLELYPFLEIEDIQAALAYAAEATGGGSESDEDPDRHESLAPVETGPGGGES
ncbi:MAG: DUF433 domain-containing protein [Verrucomicrobiales bacterium]